MPELEFFDHVEGALSDAGLQQLADGAKRALPLCLANANMVATGSESARAPLGRLQLVEISVISDQAIAAVHGDFMDDPTPTDVITFHHGEILVSLDTARARAKELQEPVLRELLLYVIHGLLHLNGHDDREPADRERMHRIQDKILDEVWPKPADGE